LPSILRKILQFSVTSPQRNKLKGILYSSPSLSNLGIATFNKGVLISWEGRIANLKKKENKFIFNLLIDYNMMTGLRARNSNPKHKGSVAGYD
jgi:hypothetical protein